MSGMKTTIVARPLLPKHPRLRFLDDAPDGAAPVTPTAPVAPTPQVPAAPATPPEFKAPTSQEELDRIIQARVAREHAKYADYDTVKAAAAKYAEIEESQKTELQKAAEKAAAAEATAAEKAAALLRYEVAAAKSITGKDLEFLTAATKEALEAQADRVLELRAAAGPVVPAPDPSIGPKGSVKPTGLAGAIAAHYETR